MEATAVLPEGRISPQDTGLWKDDHIGPLRKITDFISQHGAVPGIQLAHAGRKASTRRPMDGGGLLAPEDGGWGTVAPSPISFRDGEPLPTAMTEDAIGAVIEAWKEAARRALEAGFGLVEIHAAHGYLLHEFLSPLSNHRDDEYGGSLENRMRLVLEVASAVRGVLGEAIPLFVRISATDWVEGGWDPHQAVELCRRLKDVGVDLIDCSSGGIVPHARIPVARGYQVAFARKIREEAMISTAAVGLITEPEQANDIITGGDADLVLIGREMLRNAYWAINAQHALDAEQTWPLQYGYAFKRR